MLILLDISLAFHDIIIIIRPAAAVAHKSGCSKKLQLNYSFGGSRVFSLSAFFYAHNFYFHLMRFHVNSLSL
jgi:hypothetical protein